MKALKNLNFTMEYQIKYKKVITILYLDIQTVTK